MNPDYFEKKNDGTYDFTDYGIYMAYYLTIQKLVTHYLQNGYKLPPEKIQPIISKLFSFIQNNISDIDDYLNKLTEIAQFIGEKNPPRFIGFVSKNFMNILEKTKDQVREKELAKIKNRLENPYYAPGDLLLEQIGEIFQKAKPLAYPLENSPTLEETTSSDSQDSPQITETRDAAENMPGILFLKISMSLFSQAPLLDKVALTENSSLSAITEQNQSESSGVTVTELPSKVEMPGILLLNSLKELFTKSKPLQLDSNNYESSSETIETVTTQLPRQFMLKEYASITNKINQFMKKKDNAGYSTWYQSLALKYKIFLSLNNLHSKEIKGQSLDWNSEIYNLTQKTGWKPDVLEKIKEEVVIYRKVLFQIHRIFQETVTKFNDPGLTGQIYAPIIAVFENDDDTKQKQTELKMLLLQITNPEEKEYLESSFRKLLDEIKLLYHID